tara:strand:- start:68 stop:385 length:318 start_codon:yes stop_codon:yes gene_type:complete
VAIAIGYLFLRFFGFFAVFAAALNCAAVGAPLLPFLRILSGVSPRAFCAFIRLRLACMFAYKPRLLATAFTFRFLLLFLFSHVIIWHYFFLFRAFAFAVLLNSLK